MKDFLLRWSRPPVFPDDPEKTLEARALQMVLLATLGFILLSIPGLLFLFVEKRLSLLLVLIMAGAAISARALAGKGRVRTGSILTLLGLGGVTAAMVLLTGPSVKATSGNLFAVVVVAGLLLGSTGALVTGVLSAIVVVTPLALWYLGHPLPIIFPNPPLVSALQELFALTATMGALFVILKGRSLALSNAEREIEEREKTQAALRESRARIRAVVEAMPIPVAWADAEHNIEYWNGSAMETFGWNGEGARTVEEWFLMAYPDPTYRREVARQWRRLVLEAPNREGRIESREYDVTCGDGTVRPMVVAGSLLSDGGILAVFHDVTDIRKAEEARLELERSLLYVQKLESLGVLTGGIAHDFNNLLMAILGSLELAISEVPPSSEVAIDLSQAMKASRRAADLTQQMLVYSGQEIHSVAEIDLNKILEENADLFRAAIPATVSMTLEKAEEPVLLRGDLSQLQQVIMNLISNASEAMGTLSGTVTLTTGSDVFDEAYLAQNRSEEKPTPGRFAFLEVRDTGCGMDEATQARVFDPFFTTKFTGRGLGMSAVLGIVRSHGGGLVLDSAPGEGTTIRVLFPAVDPQASAAEAETRLL